MKFSIIVPVYNVENYIKKCLDSIVNQTFEDYEVVVVDDQTPDNSMQIVQEFADKFPDKFNIIHQENKGLGGARNTGVSAAKGDYLIFVDSDDYIEPDMLLILNNHLCENPCDILEFNYREVSPSGKELRKQTISDNVKVFTKLQDKATLFLGPPIACNKVFGREFFIESRVLFPEKTLYEDAVTRILIAKAKCVVRCSEYLYNYVQHKGSIMNSQVSERVLDIVKVAESVYQTFLDEKLIEDYKEALEAALITSLLRIISDVVRQNPKHIIRQQITDYTVNKFPNFQKNQYLTEDAKKKLVCLVNGDISGYKKYDKIMKIKAFLLQSSLFRTLNNLRKGV